MVGFLFWCLDQVYKGHGSVRSTQVVAIKILYSTHSRYHTLQPQTPPALYQSPLCPISYGQQSSCTLPGQAMWRTTVASYESQEYSVLCRRSLQFQHGKSGRLHCYEDMECEFCDHVLPAAAYFMQHLEHLGYVHMQWVDELQSLIAYESQLLQQVQPFLHWWGPHILLDIPAEEPLIFSSFLLKYSTIIRHQQNGSNVQKWKPSFRSTAFKLTNACKC